MAEETNEWCMGLPLVQRRELETEERQRLEQQAMLLHRCGVGILLLLPLLAIVACAVAWSMSNTADEMRGALAVGGIILSVVLGPLCLLVVRDVLERRKALVKDLGDRSVKRFAGVFQPEMGAKELRQKLRHARFAPNEATGEWSIETLAASGRLWRVQDQPVKQWRTVPIVQVAQTPEIAGIAAQWLQPVQVGGHDLLRGQRAMSPAEQEEIRRYTRRLLLRFLPGALALTLWVSVIFAAMWSSRHEPRDKPESVPVFLIVVTFITDVHFAVMLGAARNLRRDARTGRVIIVRAKETEAAEINTTATNAGQANKGNAVADVIEFLPLSRRRWTESGRPATWRVTNIVG